jgi:predicted glutamine amidotransferase
MCRLFGLLGSRVTLAAPWLVESERSLLAQSHVDEETAQRDGWGIAWYERSRVPRIEKGAKGAFEPEERVRFEAAARAARGPVVLGHLRHASNPMGLPYTRLIAMENSQPFGYGGYMFIHNGAISLPRETRPLLGKFERELRGVNDSEVLFWLLVKNLETYGDPLAAYSEARRELKKVWEGHTPRPQHAYTGLDVIFSRGPNEIWAFCHWLGEHGSALFAKEQPYYRMGYRTDTKVLIVGSEPFEPHPSDWRPLENGQYLVGQIDHGLIGVKTGPIP